MTDVLPTARVLVKRSASANPPESLRFGELAYADGGDGQLYIGRANGDIKLISASSAVGTGPQGPQGVQGEPGPAGPKGDPGEAGSSIIHVGFGPPTDASKLLWIQIDANGSIVERWHINGAGLWVSDQLWTVSSAADTLNSNKLYKHGCPLFGDHVWIERMDVRGRSNSDFQSASKWEFKLALVNSAAQEVPVWVLELSGLSKNAVFNVSEPVGLDFALTDALAVWHRSKRIGPGTKLRFVSIKTYLRRLYAAPD